jgi:5-carboxymethyl-2-hydroxymuconate isomerase
VPQITVEYSRNLETRADIRVLVDAVHEAARATGLFERGFGIRTRAEPRDVYRVADGDPANAFVAVILRIAEGRSVEQRTKLADEVFAAVCDHLAHVSATSPLAISLEVQEIPDLHARNRNNLHERLTGRPKPQRGAASQS